MEPARGGISIVVDASNFDAPLHRPALQCTAVIGVIKTAQHHHIDTNLIDLCAHGVQGKGTNNGTSVADCNQLLSGHLWGRDHIGIE